MKKLATLALLAAAAASASAQSSVTLFGVVDLAARSVKNGDASVSTLSSNGLTTSRIGVRGTEDLGSGLTAGFWLEGALFADKGAADTSRFWGRRSTLSLTGGFGELRLGRDYTPSYTGFSAFDSFGDVGVAAGGKFNSKLGTNVDTNTRADNQVSYFLPSGLSGFYGSVAIAPGEGTAGKKYMGGRAGYAAGPLDLSLAYGSTEVTPRAGTGDDKFKVFNLGAAYDLGVAKLTGYYTQTKYATLKLGTYNIGASVPMGMGSLRLGYTHVDASGTLNTVSSEMNDASQLAIGYVYNVSKRTALYGTVARVDNKGVAAYTVNDVSADLPVAVAGKKSTGYELGIRHSF